MQVFERALLRARYRSVFTQGFNPKPKIEFAQPLSLGITGEAEIAQAEVQNFDGEQAFSEAMNRALPEGFYIMRVRYLPPFQVGQKKHSLMSLYRGATYTIELSERSDKLLLERVGERMANDGSGGLDNVEIASADSDGLVLRVMQAPGRTGNVLKLLASLGFDDNDRSDLRITRTGLIAAPTVPGDRELCSYFDLKL
jgi:hypothetical protein